ncbi:MAG: ABC transporter, partial [Rhodoferax sp.]|nr:ABC transporter [Rhodoferax sp.]
LDEAKRQRELSKEEAKSNKPAPAIAPPPLSKTTPEQLRKWKKELAAVEEKMATLSAEDAALQARLSTHPHPQQIAETGKRLKQLAQELKALEDSWLALTTNLEA